MSEVFLIKHPKRPDAGVIQCGPAAWPEFQANGWVKVEEKSSTSPAPDLKNQDVTKAKPKE